MREQTSLQKEFDLNEEVDLVLENEERVVDAFQLPVRNWNLLIDSYNSAHKRKFPFSSLQCKVIVEFVKKGIPPMYIFQTLGVSPQRFGNYKTKWIDLDERLEILASKEALTDDEYDELNEAMRNPMRILMSDIHRAEGVASLNEWEKFNMYALEKGQTDLLMAKMRAKFKEFQEKDGGANNLNVNINVGGDWVSEL